MSPIPLLLTLAAPTWVAQACEGGDPSVEAYTALSDAEQIVVVERYLAELETTFDKVDEALRNATGQSPFRVTGRLKSIESFRAKVERKNDGCFSQITDAVAMRVVIPDYAALPYLMEAIESRFDVIEKQYRLTRVEHPGYRSLHYLVDVDGRTAELQVLTRRGSVWADAAQTLYFSGGRRHDGLLADFFWDLSRAIYLRDSGIASALPPVPASLHSEIRIELERVVDGVASVDRPKDGADAGVAGHMALDDFGPVQYAWQRAMLAPRCTITGSNTTANAYLDIVSEYRRGDTASAVERLRELHPSAVNDAIGVIERETPPLSQPCLHAAAMAHTEAAIAEKKALSWMPAEDQLAAVRILLRLFPTDETREKFLRDWLLAMGWLHQRMIVNVGAIYGFAQAQQYFGEALDRFPDDGEILLSAGALLEWAGSLRLGQESHLEEAEILLVRSLGVLPRSVEAHLRLGNVLEKRGKYDEARTPLMEILELPADDVSLYRAHMTLGSLDQRGARPRDAREHYERAIEIRPTWQVARLALAHCLHQMGARARSKELLEKMFSLPIADDSAAWSEYELGLSTRLEAHLERMRQDVDF